MSASVPGAVGGLYDVGENLDARLPDCPPEQAWARRRDEYRLVNPANRRKLTVIVVGTGLAGAGPCPPAPSAPVPCWRPASSSGSSSSSTSST